MFLDIFNNIFRSNFLQNLLGAKFPSIITNWLTTPLPRSLVSHWKSGQWRFYHQYTHVYFCNRKSMILSTMTVKSISEDRWYMYHITVIWCLTPLSTIFLLYPLSWRSVLLVEETGENHRPAAPPWYDFVNIIEIFVKNTIFHEYHHIWKKTYHPFEIFSNVTESFPFYGFFVLSFGHVKPTLYHRQT